MNKKNINYVVPITLLAITMLVTSLNLYSSVTAVTTRNLSTQVDGKRYRVTFDDIKAAPMVDGNPAKRKLTLLTLAPGQQLLSFVSKVTTGFALPAEANVNVVSIRAYQSGVEVSRGDLAQPPELTSPVFENRLPPNNSEYGIYSEDVSTDISLIVTGDSPTLNDLTAGSVDFLVTILR